MPRMRVFDISELIKIVALFSLVNTINADTFVNDDLNISPTPEKFNICHGGTCEQLADVSVSPQQWQIIKNNFNDNQTAVDERQNIRKAIAMMETIVGKQTDTYNDKAENISDKELNHYMDCIDESTNTSLYLKMLKNDGVIKFHTVQDRENRGFFFNGWPHTTAVIKDIQTGKRYAVDAWFLANGEKPFIVPLQEWFDGWRAPK